MVDVGSPGEGFRRRRFGWGYDVGGVDAFLARVDAGMVSAEEVEQVQLKTVFTGGYDEREVDDAFDEIAQRLRASSPPDDRR